MKVALLTLDFPPSVGGVQTFLFEIASVLGRYHDLTVVTPGFAASSSKESFRRHLISSADPFEILGVLRALQPDRILIGHAHPKLLLPAAIVAWGRYMTIAHGNDYLAMQNHWHTRLSNWLLKASRPLITTSKSNAERLGSLGIAVRIIPPGTDPDRFFPADSARQHPPTLLTVGRLVTRKGFDLVIRILPTLLAERPDLIYYIVGEGPDKARLVNLSEQYQVGHAIHFLGRVLEQDLPEVYRAADIFIMPAGEDPERNSIEGFGIVYLEASASGLPIVAGRSGGTADAVRDGETGFLVEPDNPSEMADTLLTLLRDPVLRRKMGTAGRHFIEKERTWDHTIKRILPYLDDKTQ